MAIIHRMGQYDSASNEVEESVSNEMEESASNDTNKYYTTLTNVTTGICKNKLIPGNDLVEVEDSFIVLTNQDTFEVNKYYTIKCLLGNEDPLDEQKYSYTVQLVKITGNSDDGYHLDESKYQNIDRQINSNTVKAGFSPRIAGMNAILIKYEDRIDMTQQPPIIDINYIPIISNSFTIREGINLLDSIIPVDNIYHIGIWGDTGLLFAINGESMQLTTKGYYELLDYDDLNFIINSIVVFPEHTLGSLSGDTMQHFVIDYQYKQQGEE